MSKDSDDYEAFIAELIKNVKKTGRNIIEINYGKKNNLIGASGQTHQIDVSFVDTSYSQSTIVLIECKRWKDPVNVTVPKLLKYNMDDITKNSLYPNNSIGIIASTSGFQSGAINIANYEKIIIQIVNHGSPYGFRYENIVQRGIAETVSCSDKVTNVLLRNCKKCGNKFEVIQNEILCTDCS
jgi:hypothetical protein